MGKLRIVALLLLLLCVAASAQSKCCGSIYEQMAAIAEKYKGEKGVKSFIAKDGFKLQTVKMMLRKEFGKEFVDNIKEFVILFYNDSKGDVSKRIVADVEQIATSLLNVDISTQLKPGAKGRGYVRFSESKERLTDMLIVMEAPLPRAIYFGGNFKSESIQYKNK